MRWESRTVGMSWTGTRPCAGMIDRAAETGSALADAGFRVQRCMAADEQATYAAR